MSKERILISNITSVHIDSGGKNKARVSLAALSLSNQGGSHPIISGWDENVSQTNSFATFSIFLGCLIHDSKIGYKKGKKYALSPEVALPTDNKNLIKLSFKDGTTLWLKRRDASRPLDISIWESLDGKDLASKITEYGLTDTTVE